MKPRSLRLPPILKAFVSAWGEDRAREFLEQYGGRDVWIAQHESPRYGITADELTRLREALRHHVPRMTSWRLSLPKADKLNILRRNEQITGLQSFVSNTIIAKQYGISERHVRNILGGGKTQESLENVEAAEKTQNPTLPHQP